MPARRTLRTRRTSTGSELWSRHLGDSISVQPALWNGTVYAISASGTLAAFDPTGAPLWSVDTGSALHPGLVIARGYIYLQVSTGSEDVLKTFSATTGDPGWTAPL